MQSNTIVRGKHARSSRKRGLGVVPWILIAICVCVAGFSGYKIYQKYADYRANQATYADINERVLEPVSYNSSTHEDGESTNPIPQRLANPIPEVDFAALKETGGADTYGWLYIPDTVMNYPVAKTGNNDKYLNHALGGKYDSGGCPFVEYRNADGLADYNIIIYGHHLRNGMMFAMLDDYVKQEFYDAHPIIYFTGPDGEKYKLYIFAAYNCDAYSDTYSVFHDTDKAAFSYSNKTNFTYAQWLEKMKKNSVIKTDVEVTPSDKVITLSTCAYSYKTERMVVQAKIVKCPGNTWYEDEI